STIGPKTSEPASTPKLSSDSSDPARAMSMSKRAITAGRDAPSVVMTIPNDARPRQAIAKAERLERKAEQQRKRQTGNSDDHVGDGPSHAAVDEHLMESASRADHQQDGGRRRETVVAEPHHLSAGEVSWPAQRPEREQEREQQCHDRVPDELQRRA